MGHKPRKPPQLETNGRSAGGIMIHTAPGAYPTVQIQAGDHIVTLTLAFERCVEHGLLPSADIMMSYSTRRADS